MNDLTFTQKLSQNNKQFPTCKKVRKLGLWGWSLEEAGKDTSLKGIQHFPVYLTKYRKN